RLEQHPLEQPPALLLAVDADAQVLAGLAELRRETVAQVFELAEAQHARAGHAPRREHHVEALARVGGHERLLELALEASDLLAQVATGGALVGARPDLR